MPFALLSTWDKTGIVELASYLNNSGWTLISTGGTAKKLREADLFVIDVKDITGFEEILDGRVKTLHPNIFGSLLAKRDNPRHLQQMDELKLIKIDMVVVNLYPFVEVINSLDCDLEKALEHIDIGGVSLLRAAAKNFKSVLPICDPNDYEKLKDWCTAQVMSTMLSKTNSKQNQNPSLNGNNFMTGDFEWRVELATKTFQTCHNYDLNISNYLKTYTKQNNNNRQNTDHEIINPTVEYKQLCPLKYGSNPDQKKAQLLFKGEQPIEILNGEPGYINMMDAINSWRLVDELRANLKMDAVASFKHVSPAGVGLGMNITSFIDNGIEPRDLRTIWNLPIKYEWADLSTMAWAFLRARNGDPLSSFGDFLAANGTVDEITAKLISIEVCDGIIAPDYEPEALKILQKKKSGKFIILKWVGDRIEIEGECSSSSMKKEETAEFREFGGTDLALSQQVVNYPNWLKIIDPNGELSLYNRIDAVLATVTTKWTQSNSVAIAHCGQIIGVGAGQQNRVDCVRLACVKGQIWKLRSHPKVLEMINRLKNEYNSNGKTLKRTTITNAVYTYIKDLPEMRSFQNLNKMVNSELEYLNLNQRNEYLKSFKIISTVLSSDAFFPFDDSIYLAHDSNLGVNLIVQPGGSIGDEVCESTANELNIKMIKTGIRVFLH